MELKTIDFFSNHTKWIFYEMKRNGFENKDKMVLRKDEIMKQFVK